MCVYNKITISSYSIVTNIISFLLILTHTPKL